MDKARPPQYRIKGNSTPDSQATSSIGSWIKKRFTSLFFPRFYAITTWIGISICGIVYCSSYLENTEKNETKGEEVVPVAESNEQNVVRDVKIENRPVVTTNNKGL